MQSVISTVLSRLNNFLDSELEQILCFDAAIDAERFCKEKCAVFTIMPEEDPNKYFLVSLIIQQLYREIMSVADANGGKLENRVMFYAEEVGTLPKISSFEMMFSASRSRRMSIVAIIQSHMQLEKTYGREGAAIIMDNCQLTIAGGFAPGSGSAELISKALGSRTVLSGSVSRGKNEQGKSLQMIERPLMTQDELKTMKKGSFVVMKTGEHPVMVRLKLFFKWGIKFGEPYSIPDKAARCVHYASRETTEAAILKKYPQEKQESAESGADVSHGGIGLDRSGGRPGGGMRIKT
jgi:type IV secretion system protein VirD4